MYIADKDMKLNHLAAMRLGNRTLGLLAMRLGIEPEFCYSYVADMCTRSRAGGAGIKPEVCYSYMTIDTRYYRFGSVITSIKKINREAEKLSQ